MTTHVFVREFVGGVLRSTCACGHVLWLRSGDRNLDRIHAAESRHAAQASADDALAADPLAQFCARCDAIHRVNEHICPSCSATLNARGDCEECLTLKQGNS